MDELRAAVRTVVEAGQEIWGERTSDLPYVALCAGVVVGDLDRQARNFRDGCRVRWDEVAKELGNLFLSSLRWATELGLDPVECVHAALKAQREYVAGQEVPER